MDVTLRAGVHSLPVSVAKVARTAVAALTAAGATGPAALALILSDNTELARLNSAHMGQDGPTDVLSFPLLPPSAFPAHSGAPSFRSGNGAREPAYQILPRQRTQLGDIVISVERAVDQANRGRGGQTGDVSWSPADELRLLVVHGVLHICGWDHAQDEERDAMRKLEREVLKNT